ncbi:tetratricopeptide repeat protein [Streptomyces sp. NBC_01077]|uniref:tetratricopeptide repeat protein n=1 Tax=Streptomyces sp. NBC_01077 TaxID=2903746 RepID=UPI003868C9E6|nr:tetratricopeptide repeat protein [Streptomyces sp. NBC_01077]
MKNTGSEVHSDSPSNGARLVDQQGQQFDAKIARITSGPSFPASTTIAAGAAESRAEEGAEDTIRSALDAALGEAERLTTEVPFTGEALGEAEPFSGADLASERIRQYLTVLYSLTFAAYQDVQRQLPEAPDAAWERFEEATRALRSEAERLSAPHQVANARQFVADLAGHRDDMALAESELRAALKDIEVAGRPWRGPRPRALLAQILLAKDEPAEAVELLHRAVSDAVRFDDAEFPMAPTYSLLGHAASHLGDFGGAVRHLSEAAARFDQDDAHDDAAEVRLQLADVLARAGQQADAVAVLESVLSEEAVASLGERLVAQARLNLARGLREVEEFLAVAEEFLRLADTVAAWEDGPQVLTLVASEAATALAMADRWEAAGAAYERAVAAHAEAPNPAQVIRMMREFARLTMLARNADGLDDALRHLAEADAVLATVPDGTEGFTAWYERGEVHYRRARTLAEADRFPEALVEAEAAVAAHEEGGKQGELARAEAVRFTALVEGNGLGRFQEAVARLATAAARCRKADLAEAAEILDALRQDYLTRQ